MSSQTTLCANSLNSNTIKCSKLLNRLDNVVDIADATGTTTIISSGTAAAGQVLAPTGSLIKLGHDGSGAQVINLPKAEPGYLLDFLIIGDNDDGDGLTINTNAADTFSPNSLFSTGGCNASVKGDNFATAGDNRLVITSAATNTGVGRGTHFTCHAVTNGNWSVRGLGGCKGNSQGGTIVFSAV